MNYTKFYRAMGKRMHYGSIFNKQGELIDLKDRGLDGFCEDTKFKHQWLLLPEWSDSVREGGKEYVICLNCLTVSHL
jgi:hypothetical protein